jgi:Na+-transporting methylmalonyl-CoA/oxaloacetate decarboxylase gamma subunit
MSGWESVVEQEGLVYAAVTTALAGMAVVFAALAIISGFIWLLPRALELLARVAPEPEETHLPPKPAAAASSEDTSIAAAIGFAMYLDKQEAKAN